MREQLHHRGPDASQIWMAENQRAGLVHTRLSIVDLSDTGSQPMSSADGRYQMVFNGEIYNYVELRKRLERDGHRFRGTSDTEVLLQLFVMNGMQCLDQLDGMFAFAVYDAQNHGLWLARDPLGEKPLYVVERDGLFAFASEVRALVAGGVASAEPDLDGINYLLRRDPFRHLTRTCATCGFFLQRIGIMSTAQRAVPIPRGTGPFRLCRRSVRSATKMKQSSACAQHFAPQSRCVGGPTCR